MNKKRLQVLQAMVLVGIVTLVGCATSTTLAPLPPEQYQKLGYTSGDACGALLLGDWLLAFMPIGLSDRVEDARADAIAKVPGATDLVNVSVKETWYYWLIGTSRCVTISGEAIKS